jgi:chromate transporter
MTHGLILHMAWVFAMLSVVSIGGANAVLPEIRRQAVDVQGWMDDKTFADIFAISNAAPGPNIIIVSLIGWHLAGVVGLVVATVAIMAPSCSLAFLAARAIARWSDNRWIGLLREALVPVELGLLLASGVSMMRTADRDAMTLVISFATAAFVLFCRKNPLWAIAAGTIANIAIQHFGLPQ